MSLFPAEFRVPFKRYRVFNLLEMAALVSPASVEMRRPDTPPEVKPSFEIQNVRSADTRLDRIGQLRIPACLYLSQHALLCIDVGLQSLALVPLKTLGGEICQ